MRIIRDEINKETHISKKLREYALDVEIEKGMKMREIQDYHYNKIAFLKKLNKAMEKQNGQQSLNR